MKTLPLELPIRSIEGVLPMNSVKRFGSAMIVPVLLFAFFGIVVGLFVVAFMFFGAVLLRTGSLSGVPLGKMLVALVLITAFTLSIHYVIGALTTNKFIINGMANFIAIGMAFLSGVMMPIEITGENAQNIAQYLPLYHFTQIYAEADITWSEAAFPILIVALYTISFLVIGMIVENKRKISS